VTCEDGIACTIDTCVEATKSCLHSPRDVDQDGDPDAHCVPGHDCDDLDPTVSSMHAEVCANGKDDNCNGLIDEQPCVTPQGYGCGTAVPIGGAGVFALSTVGCNKTFSTSCSVSNPQAARDVVAAVTIPKGPNVDLDVWATSAAGVETSVAIQAFCGTRTTEVACGSAPGATNVRARARDLSPGTYYVVVTTQSETSVELQVAFLTPTPKAANVDCGSAIPIQPGTPTTASIVDPPTLLASACPTGTGQLTFALSLTQLQDVRVYATTLKGSGSPIVGLRAPACSGASDEIRCAAAGSPPLYARSVPAGRYVVTLAATSAIDAALSIVLSAPSTAPADQTCVAPPTIGNNQTVSVDLSNHESAINDGCFPGGPIAAYDLPIAAPSDVLLVGRLPQSERGAVSLDTVPCDVASKLACDVEPTPARVAKRNVPAGDYRALIADELGLQGTLDALVRPTVAPTIIPPRGADTCAQAIDVSAGGFFTGDTSTATANYGNPCDAPTSLNGGAPDQVLSLVLLQPQRVVLDMEGSSYTTILDVRQGPSCPGSPLTNACHVGFSGQKSFLDLKLAAGAYFLIVDGYAQASGMWSLDVRVLPP
jgi:hypothetical protein